GIRDDEGGDACGQASFEAIAALEAPLTLVRPNDEQRAVVETFLTDPPVPPEPVAVVGDVVTLQRRQCDHHELGAGLALELFELAVDARAGGGLKDPRLVDDPAAQRRKGRL